MESVATPQPEQIPSSPAMIGTPAGRAILLLSLIHISVDKGLGIFNGDMGIIRQINDFAEQMIIEFDEGRMVELSLIHIFFFKNAVLP